MNRLTRALATPMAAQMVLGKVQTVPALKALKRHCRQAPSYRRANSQIEPQAH